MMIQNIQGQPRGKNNEANKLFLEVAKNIKNEKKIIR